MTLRELVVGLREKRYRVQVVRPLQRGEAGPPNVTDNELTVLGLPIPTYPDLRFGLPCRNRLLWAWRNDPPDIVHVATEGPLGLSAIRAARTIGIPVTSTFHTNFHSYSDHYNAPFMSRMVLAFLQWIHNQTRCTMAPTRELATQLSKEGFKNMDVFGRGVRLDIFNPRARDTKLREEWGAGIDDPVIIHVSRLAAEKNYKLLVSAYRRIKTRIPNAQFVIVGGGPRDSALKKDLPYAHFTGPIPLDKREDLARHYASADIFLFASLTETYGNVVTESMACGNAVVAFDYAAPALHINHSENGMLAPFGDESSFLNTSLEVAQDLKRARSFGATAAYAPSFDWQPVIDRFEDILITCLAK